MIESLEDRADKAEDQVEKVFPGSHWVETLARIGYSAKGVVYAVVGILALRAAYEVGAEAKGPQEALQEMAGQPFGMTMLGLVGLGLLCYASWRFVLATLDPKNLGLGAKSMVKRIGYVGSGVANASLSIAAFQIVLGGFSNGDTQEEWVREFVFDPIGQALIIGAGLVMIGVGVHHAYRAYEASFVEKFGSSISKKMQTVARRIGRVGLSARAIAFSLIGVFLISAAWFQDPEETGDMGDAISTMQYDQFGPMVFSIVAIGFICYSIYCFFYARYRDFNTDV